MTAYLYVLWAVTDDLVKIGISTRLQKRIAAHSGNSSNPLEFQRWQIYQFFELEEARKVEKLVLKRLAKQGFLHRGKKELFKCSPTDADKVIHEVALEERISILREFPCDLDEMLQAFADFPSLPEYGIETLTSDQRKVYFKGLRDALYCLSYLDGIAISRVDFLQIMGKVAAIEKEQINSEFWQLMIDHYRNLGSRRLSKQELDSINAIAMQALEKINWQRRNAYIDWQKLEDE